MKKLIKRFPNGLRKQQKNNRQNVAAHVVNRNDAGWRSLAPCRAHNPETPVQIRYPLPIYGLKE